LVAFQGVFHVYQEEVPELALAVDGIVVVAAFPVEVHQTQEVED